MIPALLISFAILIVLSVPVAFTLGVTALIGLLMKGNTPLVVIPSKIFGGVDSFTLLAIPFFILAGDLMDTGGLSRRLVNLARVLVGHLRGGLGIVVVVGEIFFSGISGSTTADVAAIGSIMIPAMTRIGYTPERAAAIVSAASGMGILVPPCLMMVVYGSLTGVSIAALFAAGFLPAAVMAIMLIVQIYIQARHDNLPREPRASWLDIARAVREAGLALLMPVIIFGGILGGIFTPTEASVVAVAYGFLLGVFIYREICWQDVGRILARTGLISGSVMLLIATANIFAWLLTVQQLPQSIAGWMQSLGHGKDLFLFMSILVFLFLFSLLDGLPALLMVIPIFVPIGIQLEIDPLHYGIIMTAITGIALFMPPVGVGLYVAANIASTTVTRAGKVLLPYLATMFLATLLIAYVPWITYLIPRLLGFWP
jgi:tripartite ATP-independent transporter DctM subunit